jgi:protein-disulfide isomerase
LVIVTEYGNFSTRYAPGSAEMRDEMDGRFGAEVAYTFRHLPLDSPWGREAALAAEAARTQGRFWEMRDELIREAPILGVRQIRRAAARAGLNLARFDRDWANEVGSERIDDDIADAEYMRVDLAPTYFINSTGYDGPIDADSVNAAVRAARDAARNRLDRAV